MLLKDLKDVHKVLLPTHMQNFRATVRNPIFSLFSLNTECLK